MKLLVSVAVINIKAEEIIKVENAIPQIVTHEEFKRVQEKLNSRRNAYINNTKELYLLSGKIQWYLRW